MNAKRTQKLRSKHSQCPGIVYVCERACMCVCCAYTNKRPSSSSSLLRIYLASEFALLVVSWVSFRSSNLFFHLAMSCTSLSFSLFLSLSVYHSVVQTHKTCNELTVSTKKKNKLKIYKHTRNI